MNLFFPGWCSRRCDQGCRRPDTWWAGREWCRLGSQKRKVKTRQGAHEPTHPHGSRMSTHWHSHDNSHLARMLESSNLDVETLWWQRRLGPSLFSRDFCYNECCTPRSDYRTQNSCLSQPMMLSKSHLFAAKHEINCAEQHRLDLKKVSSQSWWRAEF